MKAHYKLFLSLALGLFITFAGCQDDEVWIWLNIQ